jgi:hypothetical protein
VYRRADELKPSDPISKSCPFEEEQIQPARNDPTPEERKGDSRFLPVAILAAIALIVILIGALVLIRGKGQKIVPQSQHNRRASSSVMKQVELLSV